MDYGIVHFLGQVDGEPAAMSASGDERPPGPVDMAFDILWLKGRESSGIFEYFLFQHTDELHFGHKRASRNS